MKSSEKAMKTPEQFAKDFFPNGYPELAEQWLDCIGAAQAEAYAAGQEAMREAAANEALEYCAYGGDFFTDVIRALPIQPLPENQTADGVNNE